MGDFDVRFWGVRGSHPVPGNGTIQFGGNTSCIEVNVNGHLIILDAGTGIIKLGDRLLTEALGNPSGFQATILFSHMHHDHNQGFPFFKPAYLGASTIYFYGPKLFQEDIAEVLARAMLPPFFPVEINELPSAKIIKSVDTSDVILIEEGCSPRVINKFREPVPEDGDGVIIEILKGYAHPKGGVLFYKIRHKGRSLVYASDTEGYAMGDQKLISFAKNTDLLIHDAQYTSDEYSDPVRARQGYGHSTPEMAIDTARKADVKKLVLFHHDPDHSDEQIKTIEQSCQKLFPESLAAYEGLEISLS